MNKTERKDWIINNQNIVDDYIYKASLEDSKIICEALPYLDYKKQIIETSSEIRNSINKEIMNFERSNCNILIKSKDLNNIIERLKIQSYESVICFYVDNNYNVIDYDEFTDYKTRSVKISDKILDLIVKNAKEKNANIYMLHNHPMKFNAIPSLKDLSFNKKKVEYFKRNDVKFVDDCIISIDDYWSYKQKKDGCFQPSKKINFFLEVCL